MAHPHKIKIGKLTLTYYDLWKKRWCFEISWHWRKLV